MPDVVMMINRNQYQRMVLYIDKEFRYSDIARNDAEFHMCDTSKYQEYIFLQCSDPHQLALALWNDKVINKYLHQTYLMRTVSTDLHWIATHESLKGEGKIIKLFGDKGVISMLGPLIPKEIELSPSERKATHVLYIIRAYNKYYFGVFPSQFAYGYLATSTKMEYSQHGDSAISRAYYKLREAFLREKDYFKSIRSGFMALDIGSSPGGWTKYLLDIGAKRVISVDPGELRLDQETMESVVYHQKTIEKCIVDGDLDGLLFDIIVCDANMDPEMAVEMIHSISSRLKERGHIIFTLKMPDRKKVKMAAKIEFCREVMSQSFEKIKMWHLFANKGKERTLIATKKVDVPPGCDFSFHELQSF